MPSWRIVAAAAGLLAYVLLSYGLMAYWPQSPWAVALLLGPLVAAMAASGWSRRHVPTLAACALLTALVVVLVVMSAQGRGPGVNWLYVLQHAAIHAGLAWGFGVTLRPGATPLITRMAGLVHESVTPAMVIYTRGLTSLWVAYFVSMIVLSLVLFAFTPWAWWSFFCVVVTPAAAGLLFVGEHVWRYWRHPEFERVTLGKVFKAYRASTQ